MVAAELWQGATAELGGNTMSWVGRSDGTEAYAGEDGQDVEEIRRGEGGYNREVEAVAGGAGGGGGTEEVVNLQRRVEALEKKLKEMEARSRETKEEEVEFVDKKKMSPSVLKDGTTFRVSFNHHSTGH